MHKYVGLIPDFANEANVPLPLTGLTQQLFRVATARGLENEDFCSTIKVLEEIAGVEVKTA